MNLLRHETSPYLLQHAQNPVYWYPWGDEAFDIAKAENKPVLLSIGYSACHWCHVMAHESFEDEETAKLMNQLFINIKVDREEYPDVDHFYMDALQAMAGTGGWPLNVFLTPDKKPFYGGTYFPPRRAYNRASWKEVLINVSQYFTQNREEVELQAAQLMQHLKDASAAPHLSKKLTMPEGKSKKELDTMILEKILVEADKNEGGFGNAPKFPATFAIRYLLNYYSIYGSTEALTQACLSLDKMAMGGIFDHIGGGFARYSTDSRWIVPHFEKMLYDNALLLEVYCIAFSITKKPLYRHVVCKTIDWIKREMMSGEFAFYSAQDADSEGMEGKYYTWTETELKEVLEEDYELFKSCFPVSEEGNWEHTNILYSDAETFKKHGMPGNPILTEACNKLLASRLLRIKPLKDDKILLGWNALMNKALSIAFLTFGEVEYLQMAVKNMEFLINTMSHQVYLYYHTIKNAQPKIPALLDDLAYMAAALVELHRATAEARYLLEAEKILQYTTRFFKTDGAVLYHYSNSNYAQVPVNKSEIYDGALPSSNSILCGVFHFLGYFFQNHKWMNEAEEMLQAVWSYFNQHPVSFAVWANHFLIFGAGEKQVCIVGPDAQKIFSDLYNKSYLANVTFLVSDRNEDNIAEIKSKFSKGETLIFVCKENSCLPPFTSVESAVTVIF